MNLPAFLRNARQFIVRVTKPSCTTVLLAPPAIVFTHSSSVQIANDELTRFPELH